MNPEVYDAVDGIDLVFDCENGMSQTYHLSDECADQLCKIIRNKLNARY